MFYGTFSEQTNSNGTNELVLKSESSPTGLVRVDNATWTWQPWSDSIRVAVIKVALLGPLLTTFVLLAVVGNILVILAVLRERHLRASLTNRFLVSLAFADLLLGSLVMPFAAIVVLFDEVWLFGADWCDIWHALDVLSSTASILNLCAIAIERYWATENPIAYASSQRRRQCVVMFAVVWLSALGISFPAIIWWRNTADYSSGGPWVCRFTSDRVYLIFSSVVSFYAPLAVMVVVYARIYQTASRLMRSFREGTKVIGPGPAYFELNSSVRQAGALSNRPILDAPRSSGKYHGLGMPSCRPTGPSLHNVCVWCLFICSSSCQGSVDMPFNCCLKCRRRRQVSVPWMPPQTAQPELMVLRVHRGGCGTGNSDASINNSNSNFNLTRSVGDAHKSAGRNSSGRRNNLLKQAGAKSASDRGSYFPFAGKNFFRSPGSLLSRTNRQYCGRLGLPKIRLVGCHETDAEEKQARSAKRMTLHPADVGFPRSAGCPHCLASEHSLPNMESGKMMAYLAAGLSNYPSQESILEAHGNMHSNQHSHSTLGQEHSHEQHQNSELIHHMQEYHQNQRLLSRLRHFTVSKRISKFVREQKAAKTLGIVMGIFICCWLPFFVCNLLMACQPNLAKTSRIFAHTWNVATWLGYLNSIVNPMVYAHSMREFRRAFLNLLCIWRLRARSGQVARGAQHKATAYGGFKATTQASGKSTFYEQHHTSGQTMRLPTQLPASQFPIPLLQTAKCHSHRLSNSISRCKPHHSHLFHSHPEIARQDICLVSAATNTTGLAAQNPPHSSQKNRHPFYKPRFEEVNFAQSAYKLQNRDSTSAKLHATSESGSLSISRFSGLAKLRWAFLKDQERRRVIQRLRLQRHAHQTANGGGNDKQSRRFPYDLGQTGNVKQRKGSFCSLRPCQTVSAGLAQSDIPIIVSNQSFMRTISEQNISLSTHCARDLSRQQPLLLFNAGEPGTNNFLQLSSGTIAHGVHMNYMTASPTYQLRMSPDNQDKFSLVKRIKASLARQKVSMFRKHRHGDRRVGEFDRRSCISADASRAAHSEGDNEAEYMQQATKFHANESYFTVLAGLLILPNSHFTYSDSNTSRNISGIHLTEAYTPNTGVANHLVMKNIIKQDDVIPAIAEQFGRRASQSMPEDLGKMGVNFILPNPTKLSKEIPSLLCKD
ncbi:unnamed protein product [Protopolystoma xenopodis]|uniref:G-protein coupled receptors family 1 profile domain-containing protein n=1 Tax=Protopolystoma xenopodis TaxID=117903 RepID=A0A3S4ZUN6_9PLAT|nr:unnamed protein product [Protopolystoma xenopodis]